MPHDFRPIATAPRDGTVIEVFDDDVGSFLMFWDPAAENPLVSKQPGIWVEIGRGMTWCEDDGFGPTWWRPAPPLPAREAGR